MGWSREVKETVLVKCGRHCCICHKFCGLKMELHHIKLKSEGGMEDEDNCIPLCFDCHADQSSYDKKHPKGTKYSEKELKMHRDKWYGLAEQNLGTGTNDHLEQDRATFNDIINFLPNNPAIDYLRVVDMGGWKINMDKLASLYVLTHEMNLKPWIEFFDSDIESLKLSLKKSIEEFESFFAVKTFPVKEMHGNHNWIPRSTDYYKDEEYRTTCEKLNKLADVIVHNYDEFIRLSRKKLGVIIVVNKDANKTNLP